MRPTSVGVSNDNATEVDTSIEADMSSDPLMQVENTGSVVRGLCIVHG